MVSNPLYSEYHPTELLLSLPSLPPFLGSFLCTGRDWPRLALPATAGCPLQHHHHHAVHVVSLYPRVSHAQGTRETGAVPSRPTALSLLSRATATWPHSPASHHASRRPSSKSRWPTTIESGRLLWRDYRPIGGLRNILGKVASLPRMFSHTQAVAPRLLQLCSFPSPMLWHTRGNILHRDPRSSPSETGNPLRKLGRLVYRDGASNAGLFGADQYKRRAYKTRPHPHIPTCVHVASRRQPKHHPPLIASVFLARALRLLE